MDLERVKKRKKDTNKTHKPREREERLKDHKRKKKKKDTCKDMFWSPNSKCKRDIGPVSPV